MFVLALHALKVRSNDLSGRCRWITVIEGVMLVIFLQRFPFFLELAIGHRNISKDRSALLAPWLLSGLTLEFTCRRDARDALASQRRRTNLDHMRPDYLHRQGHTLQSLPQIKDT